MSTEEILVLSPTVKVEHKSVKADSSNSEDTEGEEEKHRIGHPHSPGFRELHERVGQFSGKKGDDDFAYGWQILKRLHETVCGQMKCKQDGFHGLW